VAKGESAQGGGVLLAAPCQELPDGGAKRDLHQRHIEGNDQPGCAVWAAHQAVSNRLESTRTEIEQRFGDQQPVERNRKTRAVAQTKEDDYGQCLSGQVTEDHVSSEGVGHLHASVL